MKPRWIALLFLIPLAVPAGVRAQGQEAPPSVVVRVRSLDTLIEHARTIVALAGREEIARQVEGLFKTRVGPKGLEGIDNTKPFGFYAHIGEQVDDIRGAFLIPIADEKAFLSLLENLNLPVTKGKDDIYSVQAKNIIKGGGNIDGYFRFAHGYLYVTVLNAGLLKNVPTPAQVLGEKAGEALAVTMRLDQLPKAGKLLLLDQVEQMLIEAKKAKEPGETAAQQGFRLACLQELGNLADMVLKQAGEIQFTLDMDEKTNQFRARLKLAGLPGSELAAALEKLGQAKSTFSGWPAAGDAGQIRFHATLPQSIQEALGKVIDETAAEALKGLRDEEKKNQARALMAALMPSFKQGTWDFAMAMSGPGKGNQFSVVAGIGLKDGAKLGQTVRDLVQDALKQIPPELQGLVKLDVETAAGIKIHRFEVPASPVDFLGDPFQLHLAFRDDALLFAIGQDGLKLIKTALAAQTPGKAPLLLYQADLAKVLRAGPKEVREMIGPALDKVFPPGKEGVLRLQVEGGAALNISFEAPLSLVQYFNALKELTKKE